MAPIPNIKLNSGHDMPQVGFGLWKVDNAVASDVVYNAIKAGYRLFDGACGKPDPISSSVHTNLLGRLRVQDRGYRRAKNKKKGSTECQLPRPLLTPPPSSFPCVNITPLLPPWSARAPPSPLSFAVVGSHP